MWTRTLSLQIRVHHKRCTNWYGSPRWQRTLHHRRLRKLALNSGTTRKSAKNASKPQKTPSNRHMTACRNSPDFQVRTARARRKSREFVQSLQHVGERHHQTHVRLPTEEMRDAPRFCSTKRCARRGDGGDVAPLPAQASPVLAYPTWGLLRVGVAHGRLVGTLRSSHAVWTPSCCWFGCACEQAVKTIGLDTQVTCSRLLVLLYDFLCSWLSPSGLAVQMLTW